MKDSEVYVSFEPAEYKSSRSSLLNTQVDLLNSIKHLQLLRRIKADKARMKNQLKEIGMQIQQNITNLELKFPKVSMPKPKVVREKVEKVDYSIPKDIEEELKQIQIELHKINA